MSAETRHPWSRMDIIIFLGTTKFYKAEELASFLGRSKPAVQGMRRKLKRLRDLGAGKREIANLLRVSDGFVHGHSLAEIRARAISHHVPVREHLRRRRLSGQRMLVDAHERRGRE